jgi:hypothetical protein
MYVKSMKQNQNKIFKMDCEILSNVKPLWNVKNKWNVNILWK